MSERDAAVHLLTAPIFHGELDRHIHAAGIDWEAIYSLRPWSNGECLLLDVAWEMWRGSPVRWDGTRTFASFAKAVTILDDENFARVIEALHIRRGVRV